MKFVAFFIVLFFQALLLHGQVDSVYQFNEIEITDARLKNISVTGRVKSYDSAMVSRNINASLADLIGANSAVFLKDNGGGRLATISIRGTTASQNTLTWNGLMINTPTLGLSDLSLFPSFFIDRVAIQYGGNGPLNGSAAIGGAVHLTSGPVFNAGWNGKIFLSAASFNDFQEGAAITFSNKKYFMRTAFFRHTAENNYSFKDSYVINYPEREQVHASIKQNGLLQEHFFLLKKDLFSIQCMFLDADREIPALMGSAFFNSEQVQKDKQLRLVTEWKHDAGKLQTMVRLGLVDDRIDYSDKMIRLVDRSHGQNVQTEAEAVYRSGMHQLQGGMIYNFSNASVNSVIGNNIQGYPVKQFLNRGAAYFSYLYNFKNVLLTTVSLRKEIENEKDYPLLPALGIRLHLFRGFYFYANAAAVYRTPTLNDLYWKPGGNALLKPEKGYQSDLRIQNHSTIKNVSLDADAGFYSMKINDWIQWVPDNNNNYSPLNIETVTSKGFECSGNISYHLRKWKTVTGGEMAYTLVTNKNGFGLANVAGKQLVFTPKINWLLTQSISYHHSTLQFQYHYTGYRFTTADNNSWLNPYGIASCLLTQKVECRYGNINITAGINNIFDKSYEVVALRPMPGRWYRISVLLNIQKDKTKTLPVSQ